MTASLSLGPPATADGAETRRPTGRVLITVFLLAFAARAAWGLVRWARDGGAAVLEFPDEQQFWAMAQSLTAGEGLRDELGFRATRMPLYPLFLSVFATLPHGLMMALAAQWLIGGVSAVWTAWLGWLVAGRRVGLIAGLLVAFDPFFVFFSSLVLTETLFIAALLLLFIAAWPMVTSTAPARLRGWLAFGVCSGLCVYLRESSAGVILLLALALLFRLGDRRSVLGAATGGLVLVVALLPWAARNSVVTGHWIVLTTRGGISLFDGVGPQASGASDLGDIKQAPEVQGLGEVEWDRYFLQESLRAIRGNPGRIARLASAKAARMWSPTANAPGYASGLHRLIAVGWTVPLYLFAIAGVIALFRRDARGSPATSRRGSGRVAVMLMLMPAIYFTMLHTLFVGSVRYRLPATPMLAVLAGVAVSALLDRARRKARATAMP